MAAQHVLITRLGGLAHPDKFRPKCRLRWPLRKDCFYSIPRTEQDNHWLTDHAPILPGFHCIRFRVIPDTGKKQLWDRRFFSFRILRSSCWRQR